MQSFVISLNKENEERRREISQQFANSSVSFDFFDAITTGDIDDVSKSLGISFHNSSLRDVEKACLLSHLKVFEKAIHDNLKYVVIFEDDIHLSRNAKIFLECEKWIPKDAAIVKLEKSNKYYHKSKAEINVDDERKLFPLTEVNWGTAGYIISTATAMRILDDLKSREDIKGADAEIFLYYLNKYGVTYQMEPALCIQDFILNESKHTRFPSIVNPQKDIKKIKVKPGFFEKIRREINRLSFKNVMAKHFSGQYKATFR